MGREKGGWFGVGRLDCWIVEIDESSLLLLLLSVVERRIREDGCLFVTDRLFG